MRREERFADAERVLKIGFWFNTILMVIKLAGGYFGDSEAVFADGVESACDFIAIAATLVALRIGRRPLDGTHPYGHGRAESIAALVVSLVIFLTGAGILARSVITVVRGSYPAPEMIAVIAAAITIMVKEYLYRFSVRVGKQLVSPALMAIAKDHRKDALSSVATLIGVTGAFFGIGIMDPLAALLTALFIFHIGYQTFGSAAHDLMDGIPAESLVSGIRSLAESIEGVEQVHDIRARRSGQYVIVDLKLEMDPEMTVKKSHDISLEVKKSIFRKFRNVGDVMIHINPHEEKHKDLTRL
ncbi:MAG TPA: cation diffusion facilitator family transporter [Geobacteraceae bacterium]|nr:cation diffusion facilitator family transporter [Geobacteraceae bacterium]